MASRSRSRGQISELTHIAPIKQGLIPGSTDMRYADRLRVVLETFNAREERGTPGVIRVFRGLHTASWALIDGDTKLLLSVVFDDDLHGYLRGLVREVPATLALVWSNCEGWADPADDPQILIDFIERYQVRMSFFYAQYPELTVPDVEELLQLKAAYAKADVALPSTRALQSELHRAMTPVSNATRIDRLFKVYGERERLEESVWALFNSLYDEKLVERVHRETFGGELPHVPPVDEVARAQGVQAMTISELPTAQATRMLFVNLPDGLDARVWLRAIERHVRFGADPSATPHVSIGFTHDGLVRTGVNRTLLTEFPGAFVEGMEARAPRLGDSAAVSGGPARAHWARAHDRDKPVHAVVFVHAHAPRDSALQAALLRAGREARAYAAPCDNAAERGTPGDRSGAARSLHDALSACLDHAQTALGLGTADSDTVAGAVLLGHQDLHKPLMAADADSEPYAVEYFGFRDGVSQPRLPGEAYSAFNAHEPAWLKERASFDPVLRREKHGLLKDATFLVARQLRQDPALFWEAMNDHARELGINARELAEQVVGRRMDGRRLDSRSDKFDPERDRHAFDPDRGASSCPFHSHVRRANPRVETDLAHNPRLLRRSMAFANARGDREARGLMFMAFNADLEGQFELIQKNWVQGGNQVGLSSHDRDVFVGLEHTPEAFKPATPARFFAALPDHDGAPSAQARELHFEQAFVALEWGIYLYFPARAALHSLSD